MDRLYLYIGSDHVIQKPSFGIRENTLRVATNARNAVQQACKKNAAGILNTYQLDLDTLCVKAPHQQILEGFESYDIAFPSDTMDEYVSLCSQKALNSLVFLNASFVSK